MNGEATDSAALRERIADLEQQLKLSDEGTSRLAERCLELEQQVQEYLAANPRQELHTNSPLLLPKLFYDAGYGLSEQDSVAAPEGCCDEISHAVTAMFELPVDASMLRFDPGELPCCITEFTISDERISIRPQNGTALADDRVLFLRNDPNLLLEGLSRYPAGLKLLISYRYYPLELLAHEPLFRIVLEGFEQNQRSCQSRAAELNEQISALQKQAAKLSEDCADYAEALDSVTSSTSWKLTAPLRRLISLMHRS